jgi:hypothetical protein
MAFPGRDEEWEDDLRWVRDRLDDDLDLEIACQLVARVLAGQNATGAEIARLIGIAQQTVADHIVPVWGLVQGRFPALGNPPRRGGQPGRWGRSDLAAATDGSAVSGLFVPGDGRSDVMKSGGVLGNSCAWDLPKSRARATVKSDRKLKCRRPKIGKGCRISI